MTNWRFGDCSSAISRMRPYLGAQSRNDRYACRTLPKITVSMLCLYFCARKDVRTSPVRWVSSGNLAPIAPRLIGSVSSIHGVNSN